MELKCLYLFVIVWTYCCTLFSGHSQSVAGCHWSHDNDFLLTYTSNREVKLWSPPYTNEPNLSFQAESSDKVSEKLN